MNGTVHSYKSTDKKQLYDQENLLKLHANLAQNPNTFFCPYVTAQRMPDVTVRSNECLPGLDVKVSHNEGYAVS